MAAADQNSCPICGQRAIVTNVASMIDGYKVACDRCGTVVVPGILITTVLKGQNSDSDIKEFLPYLSAYTRQATERGEQVVLDETNWQDFALAHKGASISRKATKLLELIAARTKPGFSTKLDPQNDPPLIDAASPQEFTFLLKHVNELGYIARGGPWSYALKAKGWDQLQSARAGTGVPGKCFVAMSFHPSLDDAYRSGIYLAVKEDCKMDPVRVDLVHHNDKICDKIIAEIRTCQFLVADFTLQRAGVYFEAGFAMGLGRPVIWTCRSDDFDNVHFDTRQYNHIVWDTPGDLRTKLSDRIKATIPTRQ